MRAFLGLEVWRWVIGNVILFKMSFGWDFYDEPWKSYALVKLQLTFKLSKNRNFCILRLFEPNFENHDQALIKWCLWLQNDILTKNLNFWLPCKKSAGNYFPNARLPPLPFLAKRQLHAYRRKVKINWGLVETLWNFGDTINVLFYMSKQKISRKLFF